MRALSRGFTAFLVIAVLLSFALYVRPFVKRRIAQIEEYIPQILAVELTQFLGRGVHVKQIHWQGVYRSRHEIEFDGLTLERIPGELGPSLASVDRVVAHYNPALLTLHFFRPLDAIDSLDIYHPVLFVLHERSGEWNVQHILRPSKKKTPPHIPLTTTIHIYDGDVTFLDLKTPHGPPQGFAAHVARINGTALLQQNGPVRFRMDGTGIPLPGSPSPITGHDTVSGVASVGGGGMALQITTDRVELAPVMRAYFLLKFASIQSGTGAGAISLQRQDAQGTVKAPFKYAITARFQQLSAIVARLPERITNASGSLAMADETIHFRVDRAAYGPAQVSGSGELLGFHQPFINGSFAVSGLTHDILAPLVKPSILNQAQLNGPFDATMSVIGQVDLPDVRGTLNIPEATFRGARLTSNQVAFDYSNRHLALTGAWFHIGGGVAALTGLVAVGRSAPGYHLTGFVRGTSIEALPLPPSLRARMPSGVITANVDVTGIASTFGATSQFSIARPAVSVKGNVFRAARASGRLDMLYRANGESAFGTRVSMNRLQISMKGKDYSAASASGVVNVQLGRAGLQGFTTQGMMTGLGGDNLNIRSASWDVRPGAGGNDEASLLIRDPRGEVGVSGQVARDLSSFHLSVLARNLDLDDLSVLAPSAPPIDGIAFVRGTLTGTPTNPTFTGRTQILQPTFGSVSFERLHGALSVTRNAVRLSHMTIHWGPGEVALSGAVSLKNFKPEGFDLTAAATGISLSQLATLAHQPLDVSGSASANVSLTGTYAHPLIAGGITLHDATVQNYALTKATTTFSYSPDLSALRAAAALKHGTTHQQATALASRQAADLLKGLELTSLDIQSPIASVHAAGATVGPDGGIDIDATVSQVSLAALRLPSQVLPLETVGAHIAIRGTVSQPEIILGLGRGDTVMTAGGTPQPLQVEINGQTFDLSADDIVLEPDLAALMGHRATGLSLIKHLSIGSLSLSGQGETVRVTGEVIPRLAAVATAGGFKLVTLAGILQQPIPAGLSGTLKSARLSVQGVLPVFSSGLSAERSRPGFFTRALRDLSGSLAVTLADVQMVPAPAAAAVRSGPTAPGTGIPPRRPPGAILVRSEPSATVSAANMADTPGTAATAPPPPPTPIQFAVGQLDASFTGPRVTINDLHFYQFAPPDPRAPGLNLETINPPGGPAPFFEIGGSMAVTAEAPLIPVSIFSPWAPIARNMSGEIQVAVRASGQTSSPVVEISVNEAVAPSPPPEPVLVPGGKVKSRRKAIPAAAVKPLPSAKPAATSTGLAPAPPGPTPLAVAGIELQRASIVATIEEGAVQLNQLIVAARGHTVEASGQIPFTWRAPAGHSHFPDDLPISLHIGLMPDTLSILRDMAPDLVTSASGALGATLSVAGTMKAYTIHGAITAGSVGAPGKILLNHFDQPIQNLVIAMGFDGQRITIDRFSGGADRGTFQLTGFAELPSAARPDGNIQISLTTNGLHLTDHGLVADTILRSRIANEAQRRPYFEQVVGDLESQIKLSGALMRPLIAGSATIHDASIRASMLPGQQNPPPGTHPFDPSFALRFAIGRKVSVAVANVLQVKPTGSFTLTDDLTHPVLNGHLDTGRGGGYVNYYVGFWRIENSVTDIHYEPPADPTASGLDIYLHATLTTQIAESNATTSQVSFFGPSGQTLQVTMEVDGRPFVPNGFHILSLTSDPPRPRTELEQLILHEQALQSILAGNTQAAIPGLFNEVVRQSLMGSILAPWEMQIASSLGLEELNVSYDFGGPLYLEASRHLFGGVSARLRQAVTGGSLESQYYFDYHLKGNSTLSLGLLQRPTYQEESLTLQTFLRF